MSTVSERGRVTIVVPARDEEGSIAEIVDGARSYGDEVIVVDGHSRDRTRQIAAEHGARVLVDRISGRS